jgi:hypothetical protein
MTILDKRHAPAGERRQPPLWEECLGHGYRVWELAQADADQRELEA